MIKKIPETRGTDKFSGFLAVTPNKKFMRLFERSNVNNLLISYHYIKTNKAYSEQILQEVVDRGGLFMTDSGIFSFLNDPKFDAHKFDWARYVDEYVEWVDKNRKNIFSCVNMDADSFVHSDSIFRWNEDYFEPLSEYINVVYGCHFNILGKGDLDMVEHYSKKYDYIGVGEKFKKYAGEIYQKSKVNKCKVHGLAWTKPTILRDYPFFSVDSSSWVNYQKYGATVHFDGVNFEQYDNKRKDVRVSMKNKCKEYDVKFYEFVHEKNQDDGEHNDDEGLTFSIKTWLDVFESLKISAKPKLVTNINKALEGKETEFKGKDNKAKNSSLADRIQVDEVLDSTPQNYEIGEDGSKVAIYEKRSEMVAITDYEKEQGSLMVCNFCSIQEKCPKFKENASCGFDFLAEEEELTPLQLINRLIKKQDARVERAMLFEQMEGGIPSKVYSQEIKMLQDLNAQKVSLLMAVQGKGLRITQTTIETGTGGESKDSNAAPKGGVAEMFKNLMQ